MPIRLATATPTITAGAYAALDAVGGKLTFSPGAAAGTYNPSSYQNIVGVLHTVIITDKAKQNAKLNLVLFGADFTATDDNAAFDPTDADLVNIIGVVPILDTDYTGFNDNSVAVVRGVSLPVVSGTIYGQLMTATGSTPTYASTSDLTVKLLILQD